MPFTPLTQEPEIQRRWLETGAFRAKRARELLRSKSTRLNSSHSRASRMPSSA